MGADQAGGARHAIILPDRLVLIVCNIFAHKRPVFYAVASKCGLFRLFSDALAIFAWRAHATIFFARNMVGAAIFVL